MISFGGIIIKVIIDAGVQAVHGVLAFVVVEFNSSWRLNYDISSSYTVGTHNMLSSTDDSLAFLSIITYTGS